MIFAVVLSNAKEPAGTVEVAKLTVENWDELAPEGKEVDAIYGDYVLRNDHVVAVIARPVATRNANMTVRSVGGALIDLTTRENQSDQLSAYYPNTRSNPFRSAAIAAAGGERTSAGIVTSPRSASVVVKAKGTDTLPEIRVKYSLNAKDRYLTVTSTYTNTSQKEIRVTLQDDIRADSGREDMVKSPNGTSNKFWFHDRFWNQAYVFQSTTHQIQSSSNSRTSLLKYADADGKTRVSLPAGESIKVVRRIAPAANLPSALAAVNDSKTSLVTMALKDEYKRPVPHARLHFTQGEKSLGSATADVNGRVQVNLAAGDYQVKFEAMGVEIGGPLSASVLEETSDQNFQFQLAGYGPGGVTAKVTDENGDPIACKIEFKAKEGTPSPNFGPDTADYFVKNLAYVPKGELERQLPAGSYDVIISHGPEYDAVFTTVDVAPGKTANVDAVLKRSVDTSGWVSSDFHSHSSPSGDNTGSQFGRVLNLLAEHIEFAPCTEHNRVSSYEGHIKRLDASSQIRTVSGMELTGSPLRLNHQNVFPMKYTPHAQDGGGPVTDISPETQIERIALWDDRSQKVIQQNHPDIGWLFYDKDGNGTPDKGFERSFQHMDIIEIHPIANALRWVPNETLPGRKGHNTVFNWMQLLNQGFQIYGVVNTDAHYNYHGSGGLRNWIQSSTDDPGKISIQEMVDASEQGRLIMSNGPFLEVEFSAKNQKSVTSGQDLAASDGEVKIDVRVQCPNWFDIDHVFLYINGRKSKEHDFSRETTPARFGNGNVKFEQQLSVKLTKDAHIIVVAGGEKSTLGPVLGSFWGQYQPTALSNPVFVDVGGDGFKANGDTLDAALPVRFGYPQK
ncbi:MAG: hypothetical protein CMJ78_03695 [Planctomycetaceae bacterium]|nr:hypothetical protein [Planctomycetaceae bacterium]